MEAVDRVWDAEGGREKGVDLGAVSQIYLDCDGLYTLRRLGFHNIG